MAKKEITFEEICRDITARKFQPVYVLMGEEPFFIDQITDLLLKSVLEESIRLFYTAQIQMLFLLSMRHVVFR